MSYDIGLVDRVSFETLQSDSSHCMRGTTDPTLNVRYNYSNHYCLAMGEKGIRTIHGMTGWESIPLLETSITKLGTDVLNHYLASTDGNVKRVLIQLLTLAKMHPYWLWKVY